MPPDEEPRCLPPFPVDDGTLDLLWTAMHPGPETERSSVSELLILLSELGGSDTRAVDPAGLELWDDYVQVLRDPQYHEHDVLTALIEEIRRLRAVSR